MKTEPNEPINFVIRQSAHHDREDIFTGLSKREYFAAMAMQGILANQQPNITMQMVIEQSVIAADALISELNKPQS